MVRVPVSYTRFVCCFLSVILCVLFPFILSADEIIWGDVNQDGSVTAVDAMLLRQHLNAIITLTPMQLTYADADRNNKIEHNDADFIDMIIVGLDQNVSFINGTVYGVNGERTPLDGALVELSDKSNSALTDSEGRFHLLVPGTGLYKFHISKDGYTPADRICSVVGGRDFWVEDSYLTALDPKITEIGDSGGTHVNQKANLEVIVPPGAINYAVREKYAQMHKLKVVPKTLPFRATWYDADSDLPGPLPSTSVFTYASLQEPDVDFVTSVTVRVKNVKGFPANTPIPYAFWNSESQQWEESHMGAVSSDAQWVIFDVGHFSPIDWNLVPNNPVNPPDDANPNPSLNDPCRNSGGVSGSPFVSFATGNVTTIHNLPSFRINSNMLRLKLTYNSATASPTCLIGADIDWTKSCTIGSQLQLMSWRLQFEGIDIWRRFVVNCSNPSKSAKHGYIWNCRNARGDYVDTGIFNYTLTLAHHFGGHYWWTDAFGARPIGDTGVPILIEENPFIPVISTGRAVVVNNRQSPFGAGWSLAFIPRLYQQPYVNPGLILVNWGNVYNEIYMSTSETPSLYTSLSADKNTISAEEDGYSLGMLKTGDSWFFNTEGFPARFETPHSVQVEFMYDPQNLLQQIVYPANKVVVFAYDTAGKLSSITDPAGRMTLFVVDPNNDLVNITNPHGVITSYAYDNNHRLIGETNPKGETTTIEYDIYSRAVNMKEPDGAIHQFFPEEVQNTIDDYPEGQGGWYNPDDALEVPSSRYIDPDGKSLFLKTLISQSAGLFEVERTLPSGEKFSLKYDYNWIVQEFKSLLGTIYKTKYNSDSNIIEIANQSTGQKYTYTWHPALKKISAITDPDANTYSFTYDSFGDLTEVTTPNNNTAYYVYDTRGRLSQVTLPGSQPSYYFYDNQDNLMKLVDPEGNTTQFSYDSVGRITALTDAMGNSYQRQYDSINRLTAYTDQGGALIQYQYDKNNNVIQITDQRGGMWQYTYDSRNRLVSITRPSGKHETFAYDGKGNIIEWINPNGGVVTFAYDGNNEPIKYTTSDNYEGLYSCSFSQKQLSLSDDTINATYTFDNDAVQISAATTLIPTNYTTYNLSFQHDKTGRRTSCTDGFGTQTYKYNKDGALIEITDTDSSKILIERDSLNRISKIIYPNTITTEYTYSPAGYLINLRYLKGTEIFAEISTLRDKVGNPVEISNTYNDDLRIISCNYDKRYQITEYTDTALSGVFTTNLIYTYNTYGQLLSDGVYTYTYDDAGNLTDKIRISSGEKWQFTYNAANQLIAASFFKGSDYTTPLLPCEYSYDPLSRRIMKKVQDVAMYYVYDGYSLLYELDEKGIIMSRYTHPPDNSIDFPLIALQDGKRFYYHLDTQKSVYMVSDENGDIVARYIYTPFGDILKQEGTFHSPFTFTAREMDSETGMLYYRHRYYIPALGRFTQTDPFALISGTNLYTYALNNPLSYMDPFGLAASCSSGGGSDDFVLPLCPPWQSPIQPNPSNSPSPNQNIHVNNLNYHLNQLNNWANVGQDTLGGGNYGYGNAAADTLMYAASDQGAHPALGPAITVVQAAPTATVGIGTFHNNAAAVNDILNLPELNPGGTSSNTVPNPFGLGGNR